MEAAIRVQEIQGQGPALEVAKRRLTAELKLVLRPLGRTDLLVRPTVTPPEIVKQSEASIREIAEVLDALAPRPLITKWLKRSSQTHI